MQFGILGPLEVRAADGQLVSVGGPRPRAVLTLLLLDNGRTVSLDRLIFDVYGDEPPSGAANAIQAHVSRLRRSLPTTPIEFTGGGYRLSVERSIVDLHRFEALLEDARSCLGTSEKSAKLREALALWRGLALADLPSDRPEAVRLEELRLAATEDLIDAAPTAVPVADLRELVAANPLRERLRGQLMRALAAAGQPAAALAEFDETRRVLADEFGADPSPELAAIHLELVRGPCTPPVAVPLTSFVGRELELDRLAELQSARLVTILGPGGTGKTRLALEHANRDKRDVCFVDLSSVVDDVAHAVLGAFGLRETGFAPAGGDPVARLRRFVAGLDRDRLLILDNCEQVVAAVAGLARTLIEAGDRLSILATSREPLAITGETLLALAPLPGLSAARLFADRAAAVRPTFVDSSTVSSTVDAVRAICAAVDGLPLAIELAAARLRQFTAPQIAARLAAAEHFRLLSRGDRTAAERHRTLHAVVQWSWDLLGPEEQVLARRLAVFSGGASALAVQAVCGFSEDRLADLVDKSLVETDGERYRMLDTIRLFGLDRLTEAGEAEDVRRAHARYLLELARDADPHLLRAEQLDWLARLGADHDNFLAALRWSVRHDRETAFGLVAALASYWWLSGRRGEVGGLATALLVDGLVDGLEEEYVSCVVHAVPRPSPEHWDRAAHVMRTLDHELRHSFGTAAWSMAAGPPPSQVDLRPRLGFCPWTSALYRLGNALLELLNGRPAAAETHLVEVLDRFTAIGERWGTAQCLDWLAVLSGWRGDWARADELWTSALTALDELGAAQEAVDVWSHRADCLIRRGDLDGAETAYRRAAALAESQPGADVLLGRARLIRLRGGRADALPLLERAFELASEGGPPARPVKAAVLTEQARLTGDVALHREALAVAHGVPHCWLADTVEGFAESLAVPPLPLLRGSSGFPADVDHYFPEAVATRVARLLGAAVGLRGMAVAGETGAARATAIARSALGEERFEQAFTDGRADPLTVLEG